MTMKNNRGIHMLNKIMTSTGLSKILEDTPNEDELRMTILYQWNTWIMEKNENDNKKWGNKLLRAMVEDGLILLPCESQIEHCKTGISQPSKDVLLTCKLLAPDIQATLEMFLKYLQKIILIHLPKLSSTSQLKLRKPALKRLAHRVI